VIDVVALTAAPSPERCAVLARGLRAVVHDETSAALVEGTTAPAGIAVRVVRLQQLVGLSARLAEPRRG
jgi:hypothetical protein